jgi:hypothetical protein
MVVLGTFASVVVPIAGHFLLPWQPFKHLIPMLAVTLTAYEIAADASSCSCG